MTTPGPDAPLTDVPRVNRMLERPEDDADPVVAEAVEAVLVLVPRWLSKPAGGWTADHRLGATMLAARLYRRKDSPGGMAQFGDGVGYVSGNWPDVALLLGIGSYAVGRVGMTWATRIVPVCQDLVDRLTAAGVPASLSRSQLRIPGAWVMPATAGLFTLSGAGTVRAHVLLVAPAAGNKDQEALEDLQGLLDRALTVLDPDEDVDTSVVFPHNNNALPAFRLTVDLDLEE